MPRGRAQRSLALVAACSSILEEIQPATVRAVCYRLFTRGLITSMALDQTKRVSRLLVEAREDGTVPWAWVVDETREPERIPTWANPAEYAEAVQRSYRRDRWREQPRQVEVWSEKGTVRGTLAPILNQYAVTFRVFHGFGSATSVYSAAEESTLDDRQGNRLALYVGDWDPSGLCMSERDLPERLTRYGGNVEIRRVALDADDTALSTGLPWFALATKRGDSRHDWFRARYGTRCWELDALSPPVLRQRVEQAITTELDLDAWGRAERVEAAERVSLTNVLSAWGEARST